MRTLAAAILIALCAAGCDVRDTVQVKLQALPLPQESPIYMQIGAQIAGPTDGLQYKWFAASGECEPQESDKPKTIFKFHEGVRQDRVSLEVWRNKKRVAQSEIKVKFDEELARSQRARPPEVHIEITQIPPADIGGPDTHADIAGKISGNVPPGYVIAIYTRAYGKWYVQPQSGSLHKINPDNTWGTWTHTGTKYAALLVRQDFEPLTKMDMLPQTNDNIMTLEIVDGRSEGQPTNAGTVPVQYSQ
jgi:hypothetical protein